MKHLTTIDRGTACTGGIPYCLEDLQISSVYCWTLTLLGDMFQDALAARHPGAATADYNAAMVSATQMCLLYHYSPQWTLCRYAVNYHSVLCSQMRAAMRYPQDGLDRRFGCQLRPSRCVSYWDSHCCYNHCYRIMQQQRAPAGAEVVALLSPALQSAFILLQRSVVHYNNRTPVPRENTHRCLVHK